MYNPNQRALEALSILFQRNINLDKRLIKELGIKIDFNPGGIRELNQYRLVSKNFRDVIDNLLEDSTRQGLDSYHFYIK